MPLGRAETEEIQPRTIDNGHVARRQRKMETRRTTERKANGTGSFQFEAQAMTQMIVKEVLAIVGEKNGETKTAIDEMETRIQTSITRLFQEVLASKADQIACRAEVDDLKNQMASLASTIQKMETRQQLLTPAPSSPTYADIAKTPPTSRQRSRSTLPTRQSGMEYHETPYCTIDTSRVEQGHKEEISLSQIRQKLDSQLQTKCKGVVKDPKNPTRVRVLCQDEHELQVVKAAAEKGLRQTQGVRILRDQLYPIKVDNVNKAEVINPNGTIKDGAANALGEENQADVAKLVWLSKKDSPKQYGSALVYLKKASDANRLLREQFFHFNGESGYTRVYEPRVGPTQCYNCQQLGHKAYSCPNAKKCANCAGDGHSHPQCIVEIPKCVLCGGPHQSFSQACKKINPNRQC